MGLNFGIAFLVIRKLANQFTSFILLFIFNIGVTIPYNNNNNNNNNNDLLVIHPQSGSSLTKCTNTITLYTKFYKLFMSISTIYNYI